MQLCQSTKGKGYGSFVITAHAGGREMEYICKLDKRRTGAKGAGPFVIYQAERLKIENFQLHVCVCEASANWKSVNNCAEMGLRR